MGSVGATNAGLSSALSTTAPIPAASPTPSPLPGYVPHRIAVNDGEFYDRLTEEKFVPRGYNYVRLSPIYGTSGQLWEETLNPGFYDPTLAEAALRQMHADGYNVVRVVVDCCRPGSNIGSRNGISASYVDNVVDFLNKAKANDIFVILVLHLTPADGPYNQPWASYRSKFDGANLRYLTRGGYDAKSWYDQDFIRALINREAPLDAVFAYDLTDDVGYDADQPPFTLQSGRIATANGETYDMAKPEERQQMMDENLVYWIDQQRAEIVEVDPTALVTASFRVITEDRPPELPHVAIWSSSADFVDLHVFLGTGWTRADDARLFDYENEFEIKGLAEKPIIIGKLAAYRYGYPSAVSAALALQEYQAVSCQHGVDGWLLWLPGSEEYTDLYNGLSDGGVINAALAPVNRPDPCQPLSARESAQAYLVFLPMGLVSAAVLVALVIKAKSRNTRISAVAGGLLAAPCAFVGASFGGAAFSQPVGSLLCGLPLLILGAGLGYLIGKRSEAS